MKGVMRFGKKVKLAPRYIRPFEILERVGTLAYRLALSPYMAQVHPVFHVSMLRKYISDPSHMLQPQSVELNEDLTFEEEPVAIVDYQVRQLRSKQIPMVKVLRRSNNVVEHTWETEAEMRTTYLYLFSRRIIVFFSFLKNLRMNFCRGKDCYNPVFMNNL